jgi:hypothetical protein
MGKAAGTMIAPLRQPAKPDAVSAPVKNSIIVMEGDAPVDPAKAALVNA